MNKMQVLPSNVEMEKFVLGGCFVHEPTMSAARNVLERDDFSIEKHRRIWHRACEAYDGGRVVNYATVANDLRRHGELESCGGISYLVDLDTNMPTLFDLNSSIQILNNFKAWRRVIEGTENAQQRCFAQEPVEDILESMSAIISGVLSCLRILSCAKRRASCSTMRTLVFFRTISLNSVSRSSGLSLSINSARA